MRHLKYPAALIALFALAISIASAIGRTQAIPERIALLHLGDMCELPCWIGITPGKTMIGEAQQIMEKVYSIEKGYQIEYNLDYIRIKKANVSWRLHYAVVTASTNDTGTIRSISLYPPNGVQMADVISVLGNPDKINLNYLARDTAYHIDYKFAGIVLAMSGTFNDLELNDMELKATRRVCSIIIWDGVANPDGQFFGEVWHGFRRYLHIPSSAFNHTTPPPLKCTT